MSVSFKYWDECADPEDMEAMWNHPEVRTEWTDAGETEGQRVHLSRDPDGQPNLTQTEMRAVAEIVTHRQFDTKLDPEMICAIAELESNRQPLATGYDKKTNLITIGVMQVAPKVAEWIVREEDYLLFPVKEDPDILYKPFVNVYFGAAYLRWLSNFDGKIRTEEFVVRAYSGGTKKVNHKSTLPYWKRYLQVKECYVSRKQFDGPSPIEAPTFPTSPVSPSKGFDLYWDSRVSSEDMEHMWNHLDVFKEWIKSKEIKGKVRFSCNKEKKPYLSRVELRAIAEIIVSKYFSTRGINPWIMKMIRFEGIKRIASPRPHCIRNQIGTRILLLKEHHMCYWIKVILSDIQKKKKKKKKRNKNYPIQAPAMHQMHHSWSI
ncbi:hypothetical protein ES332_A01G117300v1 [Gossypium tomentosum]|uniref:Transglycosylase SLT domain-containing protein n=1 Tax=Gossypium tomentosum TaxID=34277 RepID=A0A5D2RRL7_GOSTO|nr:hypothetical protein ES332_A01G117300v1 [Gossypium tomentosum]